MKTKEDKS